MKPLARYPIQCLLAMAVLWAGMKYVGASETLSCRQLVDMVAQSGPIDFQKAQLLQSESGTQPQVKCVAHQSMALLLIRSQKYSEAWKELTADPKSLAAASPSLQLQNEKIKLWLLIEARSNKAEDQLKSLVTLVTKCDKENDRQDASYALGKMLKVLHACDTPPGVNRKTLDRAKEILETQSSKNSAAEFQKGWADVHALEASMRELVSQCQDRPQAERIAADLTKQTGLKDMQIEEDVAKLKDEKKTADQLNDHRRAALKQVRQIALEMRKPTPGKPSPPKEPREPSRPSGKVSDSERRDYDSDMRDYRRKLDEYYRAQRDYPARLAAWENIDRARRANLAQQKAQADNVAGDANAKADAQDEIVKQLDAQLEKSEAALLGLRGRLAAAKFLSNTSDTSSSRFDLVQKPSHYPTIDYKREALRLSRMVSAKP